MTYALILKTYDPVVRNKAALKSWETRKRNAQKKLDEAKVKEAPTPKSKPVQAPVAEVPKKVKHSDLTDKHTLSDVEDAIRGDLNETFIMFSGDGRKLEVHKGGKGSVMIPFETVDKSRKLGDTVFTHNHPDDEGEGGGGTFSVGDMITAASMNVAEVRAVARDFTYSFKRPPTGWPSREDMKKLARRYLNRASKEAQMRILTNYPPTSTLPVEEQKAMTIQKRAVVRETLHERYAVRLAKYLNAEYVRTAV